MAIQSSAVGMEMEPHSTEISTRMALAYAAGIGFVGEATFDDAATAGIVAPPPFCVSLEWPVVSSARTKHQLGASQEERIRGVHTGQDSTFHRPIRPGHRLTTTGRIMAVRPTRPGALVTSKIETRDTDSGEPVVTTWSVSLYRGVEVAGGEAVQESPPGLPKGTAESTQLTEIEIPRWLPHVYTEAARIWNPIHTERRVALEAGLPDIILHGTATWALAAREIIRSYGGDPTRLARLGGRFRALVIPGTTLTMEHGQDKEGTVYFTVCNQDGEPAIADGVAVMR